MSGKAAVVKSLLEMGVKADSRQPQSQLENQLDRLKMKRCLSEASGVLRHFGTGHFDTRTL